MRTTTLQLDDDLLEAAEQRAQRTGQTLDQVIAAVLRKAFKTAEPAKPFKLRWVTVEGTAQPDVDLSSRDSLFERMEGRGSAPAT